VQGLSVLARKFGIPVYFTEATHRAWVRWMTPQRRMSYADWLAARKAEVARKAEEAALAGEPSGAQETNPFYREGELKACAEEAAELAGELEEQAGEEISGEAGEAERRARPSADPCALPAVEYFRAGKPFAIGDLKVSAFTIPHDAADPVGFVLEGEGVRIGFATDLGYMPANVAQQLRGCDCMLLESNHDLDMLRDGPYPWSVKQRVLSRVGHLSNAAAAEFLEKGYDGGARYIVLAHLSQSNNLPELARIAAEWALRERMHLLANKVVVAAQEEPTEPIYL
jgi:phosphoribosyl 1,2-cyclic phosphodiesterase